MPNSLNGRKEGDGLIGNASNEMSKLCAFHEIDLSTYKGKYNKITIARNLVDYEVGRVILETALNVVRESNIQQKNLFEL